MDYCIKHDLDYKTTAKVYEVSYANVYNWVKKYKADGEEGLSDKRGKHKTDDEVDEVSQLEVRLLKKSRRNRKKAIYRTSKYEIEYETIKEISEEEKEKRLKPNITKMCHILDVKHANYYKWLHHEKSSRDLENKELAEYIKKYDIMFDHRLGYRMMCDRINRDENKHYNDKQVYKIMNVLGIKSIIRCKSHSCNVRKKNNTADNQLKRNFNAFQPNENGLVMLLNSSTAHIMKRNYI